MGFQTKHEFYQKFNSAQWNTMDLLIAHLFADNRDKIEIIYKSQVNTPDAYT